MSAPPPVRPSGRVTRGMDSALNRIYFHAMGLTRAQLDDRPMVGVVAAWHGATSAGDLLPRAASAAEEGVWAAGGTPRQFATIAEVGDPGPTSGVRPGLITREIVADSVELAVRGHRYDALVGVAAAPQALAGLVLAACRLDVPAIVVPVLGAAAHGDAETEGLAAIAADLGLALPLAGPPRTVGDEIAAARAAGRAAAARVAEGSTPRRTATAARIREAAGRLGRRGAPAGLTVQLTAIAHECGHGLTLAELAGLAGAGGGRTAHVTGTLVPDGALLDGPGRDVTAEALVFDDEQTATERLRADGWPDGTVLVVRGQGPLGGPGMPTLDALAAAIAGLEPRDGRVLVTDGLAPPLTGITAITAAGPEAALGGPLARLRSGDRVRLAGGRLEVDASVLDRPPTEHPLVFAGHPVVAKYRRTVRPACVGALTHPGAAQETTRYADS